MLHLVKPLFALAVLTAPFTSAALADSPPEAPISPQFITADTQARLTPQRVLHTLRTRNKDFAKGALTVRNTSERIRKAVDGQHPGAIVLSCIDSRVPVEDVFHSGIGDLFVARVAGNTANPEILGSLEYACKVAGAKVIVVLGHDSCGAIKSAVDHVEMGDNISSLLRPIQRAAGQISSFKGARTSKNPAYLEAVCHENIRAVIRHIREKSLILREMEEKKEIIVIGGEYHLESGRVDFLE